MKNTFQQFLNQSAQGDILLKKIDKLPDNAVLQASKDKIYVLSHSETSHRHAVKEQEGVKFYHHANDNFIAYLVVDNPNGALVEHHKNASDAHETIKCEPGIYEVRRQQEWDVFGKIRPVID